MWLPSKPAVHVIKTRIDQACSTNRTLNQQTGNLRPPINFQRTIPLQVRVYRTCISHLRVVPRHLTASTLFTSAEMPLHFCSFQGRAFAVGLGLNKRSASGTAAFIVHLTTEPGFHKDLVLGLGFCRSFCRTLCRTFAVPCSNFRRNICIFKDRVNKDRVNKNRVLSGVRRRLGRRRTPSASSRERSWRGRWQKCGPT